jgi:hypothetical protein
MCPKSGHSLGSDSAEFLKTENGRQEQVVVYLRNQNIKDELFAELYKKRRECGKVHGHIKDTIIMCQKNKIRKQSSLLFAKFRCLSTIGAY